MKTEIFASALSITFLAFALCGPVAAEEFPGERWTSATPAEVGLDADRLNEARDYALTGGGSGYITRGGKRPIHGPTMTISTRRMATGRVLSRTSTSNR